METKRQISLMALNFTLNFTPKEKLVATEISGSILPIPNIQKEIFLFP
jgi:hypothetical protein